MAQNTVLEYDAAGRVRRARQKMLAAAGQPEYEMGYEYFASGESKKVTYPSGRVVDYSVDEAGRVSGVSSGATVYASGAKYAAHGGMTELKLAVRNVADPNMHLLETRTYNARLHLVETAWAKGGTALLALTNYYCRNRAAACATNNGNVLSQRTLAGSPYFLAEQWYEYDALNRIALAAEQASEPGSFGSCPAGALWCRKYGADQWSNQWVQDSAGLAAPPAMPTTALWFDGNNRLVHPSVPIVVDAAGNQTQVGASLFAYDAENRLKSVTLNGNTTVYGYDADGRRVWKQTPVATTTYVYDARGLLAAEYGGESGGETGTRYVMTDHLGSTRLVVKEDGTEARRFDYEPYGMELGAGVGDRTAAMGYGEWAGVRLRFTGKERDGETATSAMPSGLDYFGARYFSGGQGRFTSPDPLLSSGRPDNPQSWNRYAYGLNNPLRFIDPTGLYEWDTTLGGACSDKDLKGGSCANFTKVQGRDILNERKAIRTELKHLAKSKDSILQAASGAIGREGVDNGVTISMGAVSPGAAAQVSFTKPLTIDPNGNPELDLRIQPGAQGGSLFINLAHEGTHIGDAQAVAAGILPFLRHVETEMHAYGATVSAARALGWSSVGPSGGPPFWNASWSKVDQQTRPPQEVFKFLLTSPIYAPKLFTTAYTR